MGRKWSRWEVIEQDASEENYFAEFGGDADKSTAFRNAGAIEAYSHDDSFQPTADSSGSVTEQVPLSNEWETQSASLDTAVSSALSGSDPFELTGLSGTTQAVELESSDDPTVAPSSVHSAGFYQPNSEPNADEEAFEVAESDRMIGVADEPWISPDSSPLSSIAENESSKPSLDDGISLEEESPTPPNHLNFESNQEIEFEEDEIEVEEDAIEVESEGDPVVIEVDELNADEIEVEEAEPVAKENASDGDDGLLRALPDDEFELEEDEPLLVRDEVSQASSAKDLDASDYQSRPLAFPAADTGTGIKRRKSEKSTLAAIKSIVSIIGGGLAAFPIAILLMWYVLGTDPLRVGPMVAQYVPFIVPERFQIGGRTYSRANRPPIDRSYKPDANAPLLPELVVAPR